MSEFAEENDLREIFERFGRVTRVFLAKDRDTNRAKGFAFISFQERSDAAKACEKIDGCEYCFSFFFNIFHLFFFSIFSSIFVHSIISPGFFPQERPKAIPEYAKLTSLFFLFFFF